MEYNWPNPSWKSIEAKSKLEDYHSNGNGVNAYVGSNHGHGNFISRGHDGYGNFTPRRLVEVANFSSYAKSFEHTSYDDYGGYERVNAIYDYFEHSPYDCYEEYHHSYGREVYSESLYDENICGRKNQNECEKEKEYELEKKENIEENEWFIEKQESIEEEQNKKEDPLLNSGSMFDPSCHDFGFMNNASIDSIVVGVRLECALLDILHDKCVEKFVENVVGLSLLAAAVTSPAPGLTGKLELYLASIVLYGSSSNSKPKLWLLQRQREPLKLCGECPSASSLPFLSSIVDFFLGSSRFRLSVPAISVVRFWVVHKIGSSMSVSFFGVPFLWLCEIRSSASVSRSIGFFQDWLLRIIVPGQKGMAHSQALGDGVVQKGAKDNVTCDTSCVPETSASNSKPLGSKETPSASVQTLGVQNKSSKKNKTFVSLFQDNWNPSEEIALSKVEDQGDEVVVQLDEIDDVIETWGYSLVGYVAGGFPGIEARISYERVLVEVDLAKELVSEIVIILPFDRVRQQNVVYENVPKSCLMCQIFRHSLDGYYKTKQAKET
ncbi:hypothetical protein M9H77_23243 [Catharanthus roseus]|uniref:Uncharacterized protein n=1 Tax=Catharanthus roseus TaxID=4058 RepID=A0ACC0AUH5_CATRO|nr:hypothetical protein M9H77_23243 [Catharanthus roseus]